MPVIINEIVIKTNVEPVARETENDRSRDEGKMAIDEIVKQSVAKVLEILEEKKER